MTPQPFDPYALFEALDRERFGYVVIGAFARVVHGSAETTRGLDIAPSMRDENLRRLGRVLDDLEAKTADGKPARPERIAADGRTRLQTRAGELSIVPTPWGTRGYDDLRIRTNRENLGRGMRVPIASVVDLARMLDASPRPEDVTRLHRLQRMLDVERELVRERRLSRGLSIDR
ncbi:MAG: hypothetical protein ACJ744_00860 [Gaiellaceae bacterium]|jgi:hypothetical protein